jgi:hypothetical protein
MLRLKAAGITVTTWREERRESPRGDKAVQAKITENPSPSGKPGMSAENPTALLGTMRRLRVEYAIREVLAPDKRAVG